MRCSCVHPSGKRTKRTEICLAKSGCEVGVKNIRRRCEFPGEIRETQVWPCPPVSIFPTCFILASGDLTYTSFSSPSSSTPIDVIHDSRGRFALHGRGRRARISHPCMCCSMVVLPYMHGYEVCLLEARMEHILSPIFLRISLQGQICTKSTRFLAPK